MPHHNCSDMVFLCYAGKKQRSLVIPISSEAGGDPSPVRHHQSPWFTIPHYKPFYRKWPRSPAVSVLHAFWQASVQSAPLSRGNCLSDFERIISFLQDD
ncbi:hypothetical protein AAFF_G00034710 [Aldrovandia affinis]|uniref:Uncharacterized protein n=1 Tax=Aldrovandia affinis TaxID=143900 RepID=A0AAD7S3H1_9TELE|nr:hypothetical protein AAFF_G00034710 [Aldrovandia affinis]